MLDQDSPQLRGIGLIPSIKRVCKKGGQTLPRLQQIALRGLRSKSADSIVLCVQARMKRRVMSAPGLAQAQQDFAVLWNMHTRQHPIHADSQIAKACSRFARRHAAQGRLTPGSDFWSSFRLHLLNLVEYHLIQPADVDHCLVSSNPSQAAAMHQILQLLHLHLRL